MKRWAEPAVSRDQTVLFAERLDDAIPIDHPVRLLDEILRQLDWAKWNAQYHSTLGQPAIAPRILAGVLLYGVMCRIRSSRALEDTLTMRLDFRWLANGHTADHTTLSEFRRRFASELKDLFVQVGLLAIQLEWTTLERMAFDGTRLRANNRRSGTRSVEELRALRQELAQQHEQAETEALQQDRAEASLFAESSVATQPQDLPQRQQQLQKAMNELERLEASGKTIPSRLPVTDPQARVTLNKDGGFSPNFTPLAGVDVETGLIVTADVIPHTDEESHLLPAVEALSEQFGVTPTQVLADGAFATGQNLQALSEKQITLYSPVKGRKDNNPALRADPTQPVDPSQWPQLPKIEVRNRSGAKQKQIDKQAFVYDATQDCYWCPNGKKLTRAKRTSEVRRGRRVYCDRYQAQPADCEACPLRTLCLQTNVKARQISRDDLEGYREEHSARMITTQAKEIYAQRRSVAERPFAVIKQRFNIRQFLLRGLDKVRIEWQWMTLAFNMTVLLGRRARAGPFTAAA